MVEALLQVEKTARSQRSQTTKQRNTCYGSQQLLGTWQLRFITGTKASRKRGGVMLAAGKFLPWWLKIQLFYGAGDLADGQGTVKNSVQLGLLKISLTGPIKFYPKTKILAFYFIHMDMYLSGWKFYSGYISNGKKREEYFYQQSIKEQAFFTYFLIENNCIATRRKGGRLALCTKV
ncbi:hypothetical protein RintRC_4530 [Richelia intracellularis]|nr:hypothetical protein RintRC_4530 [Richelia intracellularis]